LKEGVSRGERKMHEREGGIKGKTIAKGRSSPSTRPEGKNFFQRKFDTTEKKGIGFRHGEESKRQTREKYNLSRIESTGCGGKKKGEETAK